MGLSVAKESRSRVNIVLILLQTIFYFTFLFSHLFNWGPWFTPLGCYQCIGTNLVLHFFSLTVINPLLILLIGSNIFLMFVKSTQKDNFVRVGSFRWIKYIVAMGSLEYCAILSIFPIWFFIFQIILFEIIPVGIFFWMGSVIPLLIVEFFFLINQKDARDINYGGDRVDLTQDQVIFYKVPKSYGKSLVFFFGSSVLLILERVSFIIHFLFDILGIPITFLPYGEDLISPMLFISLGLMVIISISFIFTANKKLDVTFNKKKKSVQISYETLFLQRNTRLHFDDIAKLEILDIRDEEYRLAIISVRFFINPQSLSEKKLYVPSTNLKLFELNQRCLRKYKHIQTPPEGYTERDFKQEFITFFRGEIPLTFDKEKWNGKKINKSHKDLKRGEGFQGIRYPWERNRIYFRLISISGIIFSFLFEIILLGFYFQYLFLASSIVWFVVPWIPSVQIGHTIAILGLLLNIQVVILLISARKNQSSKLYLFTFVGTLISPILDFCALIYPLTLIYSWSLIIPSSLSWFLDVLSLILLFFILSLFLKIAGSISGVFGEWKSFKSSDMTSEVDEKHADQ